MRIANEYHFIFSLTPNSKPFSFVHYLAMVSCHGVNRLSLINFYCKYDPLRRLVGKGQTLLDCHPCRAAIRNLWQEVASSRTHGRRNAARDPVGEGRDL